MRREIQMELVKNIFFNTDKLTQNSTIKISYTGKSWCVGHLVQLAEAAAYGEQYKKWQLDSLPILPEEWQYAVAQVISPRMT